MLHIPASEACRASQLDADLDTSEIVFVTSDLASPMTLLGIVSAFAVIRRNARPQPLLDEIVCQAVAEPLLPSQSSRVGVSL